MTDDLINLIKNKHGYICFVQMQKLLNLVKINDQRIAYVELIYADTGGSVRSAVFATEVEEMYDRLGSEIVFQYYSQGLKDYLNADFRFEIWLY